MMHLTRLPAVLMAVTALGMASLSARGATNVLYSTSFSAAEGYNHRYELAGQKSWVKDTVSSGGNGVITNFLGSYAAYVGLFSLEPVDGWINVWQPLNYNFSPVMASNPVVEFTTRIAIIDSTTTNRDFFSWSVYNSDAQRLLTIDFDNEYLEVFYYLYGNEASYVETGVFFTNDVVYQLKVRMELAANRWSAWLDNAVIATNAPLAGTGMLRDVGDVDAVWYPFNPQKPGDNFMIFDDYKVVLETRSSSPPPPVTLRPLGRTSSGEFLLRVQGQNGLRYAVEGSANLSSWTALRTNTIVDGYFDYIDSNSPPARRFYRARFVP